MKHPKDLLKEELLHAAKTSDSLSIRAYAQYLLLKYWGTPK